jgi:hypothetical protein
MDEGDAEAHGVGNAADLDGFVIKKNFAGVGLVHATEDFHEGGFSGAVFADESEDFAALDAEADVIEGDDAREAFPDGAQFEKRPRRGGISWGGCLQAIYRGGF